MFLLLITLLSVLAARCCASPEEPKKVAHCFVAYISIKNSSSKDSSFRFEFHDIPEYLSDPKTTKAQIFLPGERCAKILKIETITENMIDTNIGEFVLYDKSLFFKPRNKNDGYYFKCSHSRIYL